MRFHGPLRARRGTDLPRSPKRKMEHGMRERDRGQALVFDRFRRATDRTLKEILYPDVEIMIGTNVGLNLFIS